MTQGPDIKGEIEPGFSLEDGASNATWHTVGRWITALLRVAFYMLMMSIIWQIRLEVNHIHYSHTDHHKKVQTSE